MTDHREASEGSGSGSPPENTRSVKDRIEVEAPADVVWKALTDARELERWFPLEARGEPEEGGSVFLSWGNEFQGSSRILVWDPPFHLRITWGGDGGNVVTDYYLEPSDDRTLLRVVSSGFSTDPEWDDWVEGTRQGWRYELASLKHYLERHRGQDRRVVYLRRRVALSREEAWERLTGPGGVPGELLRGRVVEDDGPRQKVLVTEDPPDGLLRLSTEPCMGRSDLRDVTVWLPGWDVAAARSRELAERWRAELERLFPEGDEV
jgi:uncharacterized protein YndB with AHSA1/START domain